MASLFRKKAAVNGGGEPRTVPVIKSGAEAQQGRRPTMEDTHVAFDDISSRLGFPQDGVLRAFYGVYDGHGGRKAAEVAETSLHEDIFSEAVFKENNGRCTDDNKVVEAIRRGFKKTDDRVIQRSKSENWTDGATVAATIILGNKLFVGNLGDAEIVLARSTPSSGVISGASPASSPSSLTAVCISEKHKPSGAEEKLRIEQAGGHVLFGRVLGSLAVSRSLGDFEFKHPQNQGTADFVSCDPFVAQVTLTPENPFMIVACDGLWDRTTYQEAVSFCEEQRQKGKNPTEAAQALVRRAIEAGSLDNVSCIVVYFNWY